MIRDSLCLDHFYLGFDSSRIGQFKRLSKLLAHCKFSKVKSGKDAWSGVYLYAADGTYFEAIDSGKDGAKYSAGIAASAWQVQYFDVRKICEEEPRLPWESYVRRFGETRQKWFTAIYLKDAFAGKKGVRPLSTWLMHYHPVHESDFPMRRTPFSIERFKSMKLTLGADHRERAELMSLALPGTTHFGKNKALLTIPSKGGREFNVEINFIKGNELAQLVDLVADAGPAANKVRAKLGGYGLEMDSKRVRLFKE